MEKHGSADNSTQSQAARKPRTGKRLGDTIYCDNCKNPFYRSPANRLKRGSGQYCSRKCMAAAFTGRQSPKKGTHPTKPCDQCGTLLTRPAWWMAQNRMAFCNHRCFGAWKAANWRGENNPSWVGGKPHYYGPNWKRQSRECRRRDKHQCQLCGIHETMWRRALDVHHIKPFRFFGKDEYKAANKLTNLITLCGRCHTFLEKLCIKGEITNWATLYSVATATPEGRRRVAIYSSKHTHTSFQQMLLPFDCDY